MADYHTNGALEAATKIVSIIENNDVCGITRAFGRADVANELLDWIDQYEAHRIQIGC